MSSYESLVRAIFCFANNSSILFKVGRVLSCYTYCYWLASFHIAYPVDLRGHLPNKRQFCESIVQRMHRVYPNHPTDPQVDRGYQPWKKLTVIAPSFFPTGIVTLRSGMWNLKFSHRLFCLLVRLFIVSQVCWQVLSPGADINQYSDIFGLCFLRWNWYNQNYWWLRL